MKSISHKHLKRVSGYIGQILRGGNCLNFQTDAKLSCCLKYHLASYFDFCYVYCVFGVFVYEREREVNMYMY